MHIDPVQVSHDEAMQCLTLLSTLVNVLHLQETPYPHVSVLSEKHGLSSRFMHFAPTQTFFQKRFENRAW